MNLKEELKNINKNSYGAISISKKPSSKFYKLRQEILKETEWMPESSKISERIYCIENNIYEWPKCKCGCGKSINSVFSKYLPYHGNKCTEIKEKKKKVYMEKYGVENPSQSKEIKDKKKTTFKKHYGYDHYMKSPIEYEKYKQQNIDKYGVENQFQRSDVIENNKRKWKENRSTILHKRSITAKRNFYKSLFNGRLKNEFLPLFSLDEYNGVGGKKYTFRCLKCNTVCYSNLDDGAIPRCLKCNPLVNTGGQSIQEKELQTYIESLNINLLNHNRKLINPFEIDFINENHKICIEYNGLYWHSDLNGKGRLYHLNKTELCKQNGYRLIHIFEDEWQSKKQIVKNRLKNIFKTKKYKIGARKCQIKEINTSLKNKFLEKYHIQGKDNSSVKLGLFYKNHLVSVMTFCKSRFNKNFEWELSRFCSIFNFNIPGGASKLLKYFERNYNPRNIITYSDLRWNTGNVYNKLGFLYSHQSNPSYWYTKNYLQRLNRNLYRKNLLSKKLSNYNSNLSEWENMKRNGYDRIWDCGNLVFIKENPKNRKR